MLNPKNGFKPLPKAWLNDEQVTVLKLYDDDIAALGWLLNIIHFQTESVPQELGWRDLVSVAIICDKYDLKRAVKLWAEQWTKVYLPENDLSWETYPEQMLKEGCEDWLFLAQAFPGVPRVLSFSQRIQSMLVEEIVGDMEDPDAGSCVRDPKGLAEKDKAILKVKYDLIPESVFYDIKNAREERFTASIAMLTQLLIDIHLLKVEIGYGIGDENPKYCQGHTQTGVCYEVTLASSASSGGQASWEIENIYCGSCLKKEAPLWRVEARIDNLESLQQYYTSTRAGARSNSQRRAQRRTKDFHNLIDDMTSRFKHF
ncbi:hypothetical protein TWF694_003778 [Orbilia ellipsospora]|uniref:Uncharacterized protein n=1 Tax=Orbilia ellipsospora TaxID=2528407 RepID=A0AAV9X021_9PEZI